MGSLKIAEHRRPRPILRLCSHPLLTCAVTLACLLLCMAHPRSIAAYAIPMVPLAVRTGFRRLAVASGARPRSRFLRRRVLRHGARRADDVVFARLASLCRIDQASPRHATQASQARLASLVAFLAHAAGLSDATARLLAKASTVHRIGYVSLPDDCQDVRTAPAAALRASRVAALLLSGDGLLLAEATDMARGHEERWDGAGQPLGMAGARIPYAARLLHTALLLDALILDQCPSGQVMTRPALSIALARLECAGGRALDPSIARLAARNADTLWPLLCHQPFAAQAAVAVKSSRRGRTESGSSALA